MCQVDLSVIGQLPVSTIREDHVIIERERWIIWSSLETIFELYKNSTTWFDNVDFCIRLYCNPPPCVCVCVCVCVQYAFYFVFCLFEFIVLFEKRKIEETKIVPFIFDQINAALGSIRDFKHKKKNRNLFICGVY